jgi:hypothetical protein
MRANDQYRIGNKTDKQKNKQAKKHNWKKKGKKKEISKNKQTNKQASKQRNAPGKNSINESRNAAGLASLRPRGVARQGRRELEIGRERAIGVMRTIQVVVVDALRSGAGGGRAHRLVFPTKSE